MPALNEEEGIRAAIESLLKIDYPREKIEYIVINDGSSDRTGEIAKSFADRGLITYIENKPNKGKATSLNIGFERASGEYVACIDADTVVDANIIKKTIPHFKNEKIAAVIVPIKVLNPKNWLEKIIAVEYNLGLGFYLKLFSWLNCLFLTPGQFSIYQKKIVLELGGFDPKSIVEDTEIAYRMQKKGYKIDCTVNTSAHTIVPHNLRGLYYQRKRWYAGTLQTILKHKNVFFNKSLGNFGIFFMPFNYGTTFIALILSLSTLCLIGTYAFETLSNLSLIRFDLVPMIQTILREGTFDPLTIRMIYFLGITPFVMNFIACYIGMKSMGQKIGENLFGFVAFLFFFIPYHIFWLIAFHAVGLRREVKWREST